MKIALALSGGGVRAAAHLGIVEVLQRNGFEIAALSGSSGGALVGALLADGYAPQEIRSIIKELKTWDLMQRSKRGGMFGLGRIERLLRAHLKTEELEELPIPFTVAATDLAEGNIHYFDKGPVAQLCAASSSLIPFFSPVRYGNLLLADGGFMDNMPTKPLKVYDCPVIGVNVNPIHPKNPDNILKTTYRALVLMMAANVEASRQHADCYIEAAGCEAINIFDLKQVDAAFDAGLEAGEAAVKKLRKRS